MKRLVATRKDGLPVATIVKAATLVDANAEFRIESCTDRVRPDIERWLKKGVVVMVHDDKGRRPHKARPTDADFLERVAVLLRGYGFVVEVS